MLEHGFLRVLKHILQVSGQFLLLEQLLRVKVIVADSLIFDAVHEREALGTVDSFRRQLDEGLGIALEIAKPSAL